MKYAMWIIGVYLLIVSFAIDMGRWFSDLPEEPYMWLGWLLIIGGLL